MKLTLTYKSVFGRDSYYPDDDNGKMIAKLGGFKTFTMDQVKMMQRESGWEIEINGYVTT